MVQSGDVLRVPEGPLFNQFEVHNHAGDTLSVKGVVSLAARVLSMDLGYVRRFPSAATFREERLASQATVTLQQEQTLEQLLNWHCIDVDRVFDNSIEAIAIQRGERRPMPQGVKGWATDINRRDIPLMVRGVVMNGNSRSSPILPLDQVVFPAGTVLPLLQLALLPAQICNQCPDRVVMDPRVVASLAELPNQTVPNTTLLGSDQDPGAVYARRADAVYQIGLRETLVETFASDQTRTVMPVVLFRDLSVFYDWESRPTAETIADHAPFTGAWHPLPSLQRGRGRGAGRGAGRGGRGAGRGRGRGRGAGRAATNSRHHPYRPPSSQGGAGCAQVQGRQTATDQHSRDTEAAVNRQRTHMQLMAAGGGGSSVSASGSAPASGIHRHPLTVLAATGAATASTVHQSPSAATRGDGVQTTPTVVDSGSSTDDDELMTLFDDIVPQQQGGNPPVSSPAPVSPPASPSLAFLQSLISDDVSGSEQEPST